MDDELWNIWVENWCKLSSICGNILAPCLFRKIFSAEEILVHIVAGIEKMASQKTAACAGRWPWVWHEITLQYGRDGMSTEVMQWWNGNLFLIDVVCATDFGLHKFNECNFQHTVVHALTVPRMGSSGGANVKAI